MKIDSFLLSDKGVVRPYNEDNMGSVETPNGEVFVVCDGMGGHVGGAKASELAVDSILRHLEQPAQNIYVAINDALQFANDQILGHAQENPELKGMGTTATVLVVQDEGCIIAHVGDSRIYLKSDGKLNRLTKDHSFVQGLVDQGVITDDQAESHPQKNQILEALGIKSKVNATISDSPVKPKKGDCFLMCSDGLNGMINDDQISSLLDQENIEVAAHNLIASANNAGGKDNITVCLVSVEESPFAVSAFKHFNPVKSFSQSTTIIEDVHPNDNKAEGGASNKKSILLIGLPILILGLFSIWFFLFRSANDTSKADEDIPAPSEQVKDSTEQQILKPIEGADASKNIGAQQPKETSETQSKPQNSEDEQILDSLNNDVQNKNPEIDQVDEVEDAEPKKLGHVTYLVKENDTYSSIARGLTSKYNREVSPKEIMDLNPNVPDSTMQVGIKIKVPAG